MGLKERLINRLRCVNSDKEELNRLILKWYRCFQEIERLLSGRKH